MTSDSLLTKQYETPSEILARLITQLVAQSGLIEMRSLSSYRTVRDSTTGALLSTLPSIATQQTPTE